MAGIPRGQRPCGMQPEPAQRQRLSSLPLHHPSKQNFSLTAGYDISLVTHYKRRIHRSQSPVFLETCKLRIEVFANPLIMTALCLTDCPCLLQFLTRNNFYVLIDDHSEDPTVQNDPNLWVQYWVQLMTDITADPVSRNRVMVDPLNEPDHAGYNWGNVGSDDHYKENLPDLHHCLKQL